MLAVMVEPTMQGARPWPPTACICRAAVFRPARWWRRVLGRAATSSIAARRAWKVGSPRPVRKALASLGRSAGRHNLSTKRPCERSVLHPPAGLAEEMVPPHTILDAVSRQMMSLGISKETARAGPASQPVAGLPRVTLAPSEHHGQPATGLSLARYLWQHSLHSPV